VEALEERCLLAGITEFGSGISPGSSPSQITQGSDGNLWFTEPGNNALGRITQAGTVAQFALAGLQASSSPLGITSGPNGLLYFTESGADRVGSINPLAGSNAAVLATLRQSKVVPSGNGTGAAGLNGITVGPDGNLWFTESTASAVGRVTPDLASITEIPTPTAAASPAGITTGPDGALWFTESAVNQVGRLVPPGTISTVAGNGTPSFGGDGGPATLAVLGGPSAVARDAAGDLYIADRNNDRVREVSSSGIITTVAGNGTDGSGGDGGPAIFAQLSSPTGVAVDAAGNLYIADANNNRVRKVSSAGIITTVAGNGTIGSGGDGGPATAAQLFSPTGVAVDAAGDLFIADSNNSRVREVSPSGTITTVAGNGTFGFGGDGGPATAAKLNSAAGVAVDAAGDLFIADTQNNRVRKVSPSGVITTVAGNGTFGPGGDGGPATAAPLAFPQAVAVDASGDLFIADTTNQRVREVSPSGIITTAAGNGFGSFSGDGGRATAAALNDPAGMAVDAAGDLFIADQSNNRVREVSSSGTITTVAGGGTGDGGPATLAPVAFPPGVAVDAAGDLFIADQDNNRVREVSPSGIITTVAGNGIGGFAGDGGRATAAELDGPAGVAVDAAGDLFIADRSDSRVREVAPSGIILTVAGNGTFGDSGDGGPATAAELGGIGGLAVDAAGDLFIADVNLDRVHKVSPSGIITTVAGNGSFGFGGDGGPATAAPLGNPTAVAVDAAGDLFIAEPYNNRVREVSPSGIITTVAGNGTGGFGGDGGPATAAELSSPAAVAIDAAGNLYIVDQDNTRVREVSPSGMITTVAGNGTFGFGGDDGPATAAQLYTPGGVAVDAAGDLYIADTNNNRIRKVTSTSGADITEFALPTPGSHPQGITTGPDGNLWFTENASHQIGTITTAGSITEFPVPSGSAPSLITVGPDGNLWFTEPAGNRVGRVTTRGQVTEYGSGITTGAGPLGITSGPDRNLWFTESAGNRVGRLIPDARLTVFGAFVNATATVAFTGQVAMLIDTDTTAAPGDYAVTIDWGDGTTTGGTVAVESGAPGSFTVSGTHTYAAAGFDSVTVTVTDTNTTTSVGGSTATAFTPAFVATAATATALSASANPVNAGQPFTLTATITPTPPASGTPTGTVTFTDTTAAGTVSLGTAPLDNTGTATLAVSGLAQGSPTIMAEYNGDPAFASSNASMTETVNGSQAPAITSAGSTTFTTGMAGTFTVTATGSPAPTLSESGFDVLPAGLTFTDNGNGTATLGGSPAAGSGGSYTLHFAAHNGAGPDASQTFNLTVNQAPAFTSANGTTFVVGTAGSFTVAVSAFPVPTLSESVGDTLPPGVTFNAATGTLGGTPAAGTGGVYTLHFKADNGVGADATQTFTLTVNAAGQAPVFTSAAGTTFTVGATGNVFSVTASGSPAPTLSENAADTLPPGVTFDAASGSLIGPPAAGSGGTYPLHFTASNGAGSASQTFTLTVDEAPAFASPNDDTFIVGTAGSFRVAARGFPVPTLSESAGDTLPGGITFDPAGQVGGDAVGLLSGTPAANTGGTYTLQLTAGNSFGSVPQTFTLTVDQAPAFTSAGSTTFTAGTLGSFTVAASGFPLPTLSESGTDSLPSGVSFNPTTGVLSGTPAANTGGTYTLHFSAGNGVGNPVSQTFTLTVNAPGQAPAFTSPTSATFIVGQTGASFQVAASGSPAPTLGESGDDMLPAGVTFTAGTGVLSGTPTAGSAGTYTLHFTASNGAGSASQTFTLTVVQAPAFTSPTSAAFTVGDTGASFRVVASGFPAPTLSESAADALPPGVSFNANTGVLSGTPAAGSTGTYPLHFTAHNGVNPDALQTLMLTVNPAGQAPVFTSPGTTTFTVGATGNTFRVVATGSPAPTLSENAADTLPAGVTFDPVTGSLIGPAAAGSGGSYTLRFTATSSAGSASQTFTLTVDEAPAFTTPNGDILIAGITGNFRVAARGFPVPSLSESPEDTLPRGLSFNSEVDNGAAVGLLQGTPAAGAGGVYILHFTAANSLVSVPQTFTLTVNQAPTFTSANGATFTAGSPGAFQVAATGFPTPSLSESGVLPTGVVFDPTTNLLRGTPAAGSAGSYTVTFTATNNVGNAVSQTFTLAVNPPPPLTGPLNLAGLVSVSAGSLTPVGKRARTGGTFQQTLTITNNGTSAIQGPIVLVLDSLTPRKKVRKKFVPQVTVVGAGGTTRAVSPGNPFVLGPALLPAGGTATFRLVFRRKGAGTITFNPVLLAGYTQP
jgi:streptogramin lyase